MNAALTKRQQEILDTIAVLLVAYRRSPTLRELGKALNITSTNGVKCHLIALRRKGKITYDRSSRSIRPVNFDVCPCCGK